MPKRSHRQLINDRGYANGWHAEQLAKKAVQLNMTCALLCVLTFTGSSGFNIPGMCTRVTRYNTYYKFTDGSKLVVSREYPYTLRDRYA